MAVKELEYNGKKFSIAYNLVGSGEKTILFLHGWGSNKEIMQGAFSKLKGFKQIYIDMPGFGKSPNEDTILTTKDYSQIIKLFLEKLGVEPTAIAGHSFGGKVATLLNPNNLILLSSAGILVPKPFKIRAKIAIFKALKPFGISALRKFFVADDAKTMNHAMYETFKNVVDEDFEHNFSNYQGKALLFWGKEDSATPLWTGEKIALLIKNSKLYPLNGDHFFFVNNSAFITKTIEDEI
jgi:pimeloyl-ACP methyl ester carboxylesterase